MNKSILKSYAPQARRDFIDMVVSRAAQLGLAEYQGRLVVEPMSVQGDVALIAGQAFPAKVAHQRQQLINRIQRDGFGQTMEAIAYTWFNRFAALRYMELQDGFLRHGQRVLSSTTSGALPDLLTHALESAEAGELPGITPQLVGDLKLTNKDGELYKRLLVAQCNALSEAMPFLFERIDDETELLLPDTLLRTDSVIRKLVDSIIEDDWQQVEIIGWLYQFYISERKEQVIGKVVQSEDIPAATQLFTPNWIVKYLVQNSVGRLWLQANPGSNLASEMAYYIQPAEQMPEVQAELDCLIQARIAEDGDTLNPESITVLDPACGSGHILVETYELLKAIYLERGYRSRDIPRLILEKNLYGLDIDDRAAQLAGFALLMKARADDRRLFDSPPRLNVFAVQQSHEVDDQTLAETVFHAAVQAEGGDAFASGQLFGGSQLATEHSSGLTVNDLRELIRLFRHGKTFGSLLKVPPPLAGKLPKLAELLEQVRQHGNALAKSYTDEIHEHYLLPTQLLAGLYDAVIANPPYMGGRNMNDLFKHFIQKNYPYSRADSFAAFIERGLELIKPTGVEAMVTMETWMFLSSYESMRETILSNTNLISLVHMPYDGKGRTSMGINFGISAFCILPHQVKNFATDFQCIRYNEIDENGVPLEFPVNNERRSLVTQAELQRIPGSPIAYWVSKAIRRVFSDSCSMSDISQPKQGLATGDNNKYVRFWHEVNFSKIGISLKDGDAASASGKRWFPHLKGGDFRKWYGNEECIVNWENDGIELRNFRDDNGKLRSRPQGIDFYFQECISWSDVTSASNSFRWHDNGFIPNVIAPVVYKKETDLRIILLAANNIFFNHVIKALNPTLHFHVGYFSNLPFPEKLASCDLSIADELIAIAREDWNSYETSWNYKRLPWENNASIAASIASSWLSWKNKKELDFHRSIELETKNNQLFIDLYDLGDELDASVPRSDITLIDANRESDSQCLVSYAIGCMMGRYSLDEPGLIYAHASNAGFDLSRYQTFAADTDGIVPVSDMPWFADDATARVKEFLAAVWGEATLAENLAWLAESLGQKGDETPEEALRRYISGSFFKDHCQTYKKRPIYWLFSSGKQKAFEALVYLHRYNESTLARLRAEYVVPLTGKMAERIKLLEDDALKAPTAAARKKIDKDIDKLKKKLDELRTYDEKLRHYADMRISLDLDDGVKVNYGKFGDLLDGVKAISGANEE